ncbi:flavin reductase family protein [Nocardioides sp. BGMRC 2183]|nr:flavin reductase family protein [Nocardioides sp. BGMRC 2183]
MSTFDLASLHASDAYKLITGVVQPRPIAWVSTLSVDGHRNLAPFSFFTVASRNPVIIFLSIGETGRENHAQKDTLANLLATSELVVNIVSEHLLDAMVRSSADVPSDIDEFDFAGVGAAMSDVVAPPRVAEARVALECRVVETRQWGTDTTVLAQVLRLHASDGITDDRFHVDTDALRPVGRSAGASYAVDLAVVPSPPVPVWEPSR